MDKDFARGERNMLNPYAFRRQPSWGDPPSRDVDFGSTKPTREENWLTLREKKRKQKQKTFKPLPPHLQSPEAARAYINATIPDPKPMESRWQPEPEPTKSPFAETKPAEPTVVAATTLTSGMLSQPSAEMGPNGQTNPAQTDLKNQKQEPKPLDPTQDQKKVAWASPLDMLDYLGLGMDVLERAYIEIGMKPGQEKEFARFSNTLYFTIDAAMAILPGAGGGGLAVRASHEAGAAAWHLLPASSKAKVVQELAKKMGWTTTRASQAVNVFFSMKAGKGGGNGDQGGGKGSQGDRVGRPSGSITPTKGPFKGKKVDYVDTGKHSKLARLTQDELEKAVKDPKNKQKIVGKFRDAIKGKGKSKDFGSQLNKEAFQRYKELIREGLENGKRSKQGILYEADFKVGIDVTTGKATSRYLIFGAPHGAHIIPIP